MPVLLYVSKIKVWREKERFRIRVVQMDNFRGLLGIKRIDTIYECMDRRELYGVKEMIKVLSNGSATLKG